MQLVSSDGGYLVQAHPTLLRNCNQLCVWTTQNFPAGMTNAFTPIKSGTFAAEGFKLAETAYNSFADDHCLLDHSNRLPLPQNYGADR